MLFYIKNDRGEYCSEGRATREDAEEDLAECERIRPDLFFAIFEEQD